MSETSGVTAPIKEALEKAGYFCMRLNSGVAKVAGRRIRLCPKGTADLVIYPPHRLPVWVETKTEKGRTNPEQLIAQADFAFKVEGLGHKYVRATCLDDVLGLL